ncbi:Z1 domain-containing protein [Flavobacteriales bacterium]|nr:Z1 domain-containing protein [Flavobacteriales bacterium]
MKNIEDQLLYTFSYLKLSDEIKNDAIISKSSIKSCVQEFHKTMFSDEPKSLIDEVILMLEEKFEYDINKNSLSVETGITLSNPKKHVEWSPKNGFYWETHKKFITEVYKEKDPENWSKILKSIDQETDILLSLMENPIRDEFDSKGLVIGYVQSGKTANFTALLSKAMDSGYKLIIVLAGMHNSLRVQTQSRLDTELFGYNDLDNEDNNISKFYFDNDEVHRNRRPIRVTKTAYIDVFDDTINDGEFRDNIEKLSDLIEIHEKYNKVVAVVKKNVTVLKKFNKWLERCPEDLRRKIPLLIIDDEADQASIDGNYVSNVRKGNDIESNVTETNNQILSIIEKFLKSSFIGYTATPFANCFIHPNFRGLYPHNFIHFLPKPEQYFGAEKIFGDEELKDAYVVSKEIETKKIATDKLLNEELPDSLNRAIMSFLITIGIRILRGDINQPMSMLIHIDHLITTQQNTFIAVDARLKETVSIINKNTPSSQKFIADLQTEYNFIKEKSIILSKRDKVKRELFSFEEVLKILKSHLNSIQVKQVHSRSEDDLNYIANPNQKVIAIGGNKLSRGLTLEGLVTTYFLRNTMLADTLMQMGRFFGYRGKYSDLMKIFCHENILDSFEYLIDLETDLRLEVSRYESEGKTPEDFSPSVRSHVKMKPSGKMGNAQRFKHAFGSSIIQTKYFDLHNKSSLESNLDLTINLLNDLDKNHTLESPKNKKKNGKLFYSITSDHIINYLENFIIKDYDINTSDVINYLKNNNIEHFNLGVSDLKNSNKKPFGNIGEFSLVSRSRKKNIHQNGQYNIGVLSAPELVDFDLAEDEERELPLIVIYRIDKNSKPKNPNSTNREDLFKGFSDNDKTDMVGFTITFPSSKQKEFDVWGQLFDK